MSGKNTRPIDADALYMDLVKMNDFGELTAKKAIRVVKNAPTIDAEPVKHGKWNMYYRMHSGDTFVCNRCGSCFVVLQGGDKMNSCPNCRARMDEE